MGWLNLFLCAFCGAVISTLPIGPVNLISLYFSLNGKARLWRRFIAGILMADVLVCLVAMHFLSWHSTSIFGEYKPYVPYVSVALAGLLLLLGGRLLIRSEEEGEKEGRAAAKYSRLKDDVMWHRLTALSGGFVATLMSPGLLVFWLAWWIKWIKDFERYVNVEDSVAAALGLVLGDLLIFFIYRALALRYGSFIVGRTGMKRINQGIGCAVILAALLIGGFSF